MKAAKFPSVLFAATFITACGQWDLPTEIRFKAAWQDNAIACSGTKPALTDLRFYIANPRLVDKEGREQDVRFATEYAWENDAVAYIDLETGKGTCAGGSAEFYDRIIGVTRAGDYRGLKFTVGVPFRLNHADFRGASSPLDLPDMHSQSVSGYKFLRAGVGTPEATFQIHIGSDGCDGTTGYVTGCDYPNRIEVYLPDFVLGQSEVQVNLDELVSDARLADGTRVSCTPSRRDGECAGALAALGIDADTGQTTGQQRVFSLRNGP